MNSSIATLTSSGRSCWVQWRRPQPGSKTGIPQVWHDVDLQPGDHRTRRRKERPTREVAVTGQEQRRHQDVRVLPRCGQLPGPVQVRCPGLSPPVNPEDSYSRTNTSMSSSVSQPGSCSGSGHRSRKPPPAGTTGMPLTGPSPEAATSRPGGSMARIAAQLGVGHAGRLEIANIETVRVHGAQRLDRRRASSRQVTNAQPDDALDPSSRRSRAVDQATGAPQSCPATTA